MKDQGFSRAYLAQSRYAMKVKLKVARPTLSDSMDYIVDGILQARIVE